MRNEGDVDVWAWNMEDENTNERAKVVDTMMRVRDLVAEESE